MVHRGDPTQGDPERSLENRRCGSWRHESPTHTASSGCRRILASVCAQNVASTKNGRAKRNILFKMPPLVLYAKPGLAASEAGSRGWVRKCNFMCVLRRGSTSPRN